MTHDENRISDLIDGGIQDKSAIDRAKYELHMRQKASIEKAAKQEYGTHIHLWAQQRDGFLKGAQHVIEHPERYALVSISPTEKKELYDILCASSANVRYYADKDKELHGIIQGLIKKFKP